MFDVHPLDAGALGEDGFIPAEAGVRWRHIAQTFVVAMVIIVLNDRIDLCFEVAGQETVFQQGAVRQRLVPSLYLPISA